MMGMRFRLAGVVGTVLLTATAALTCPQRVHAQSEPQAYRLGIFPYMAPRQTIEFFGPVAANMQAALQHPVRLESVSTFGEFTRQMASGRYDIALVQPFDYPETVDSKGYIPLAQMSVRLVTQLFVREDSSYRAIEDLRGTTIAMPPAASANARMALRALYDNKLIPGRDVQVRYFNSHDSCLQQVWAGTASACGTALPPVQVFVKRMQAQLRPIHDTPSIPHIVFVAHPRVPAADRTRLQALIMGWRDSAEGRAILKDLGFPGFTAPRPADYVMMRNYDPVAVVATAQSPSGKGFQFGVFPFLTARQLAENFGPAMQALSAAAGVPMNLRTTRSFDSFSQALTVGSYDVIVVQPFDYAHAAQHGYLPLAGMKNHLQGTFFVLDKSRFGRVEDFRGEVVAMPPRDAAQSRLGRDALIRAGLVPGRDVKLEYRLTHDSCLQRVQSGAVAACVTAELTLPMLPRELTRGLRNVGMTQKVPGLLFMAHQRVPDEMRTRLRDEITGWKNDQAGRRILEAMNLGEFVPVDVEAYRRMPKLEGSP